MGLWIDPSTPPPPSATCLQTILFNFIYCYLRAFFMPSSLLVCIINIKRTSHFYNMRDSIKTSRFTSNFLKQNLMCVSSVLLSKSEVQCTLYIHSILPISETLKGNLKSYSHGKILTYQVSFMEIFTFLGFHLSIFICATHSLVLR